ncbi:hypothetical protein ES332_A07G005100v1 [Gossypium tomentosum]|uniref:Nucleoside phosphorylase domain-containing protein n=1 Tax=Gossypium tomentosum TaxID=34277 RepID=A0A5D2PLT5_GOSTO|nr:hypothetical protein ES332_A07G005100v1 [Gossypium tomentosum]
MMGLSLKMVLFVHVLVVLGFGINGVYGLLSSSTLRNIDNINMEGPYLGIIVPNSFEMNPLLQTGSFLEDHKMPYLDFAGRRFRIGRLENERVIIVMTGLSMLNAGIATQLLITLFKVKGILHYGIAGNANSQLQIGDVTIPQFWAHTGLWNWQRYGDGPEDELALESNGDYTREIGYLRFSDYYNGTNFNKHYFAIAERVQGLRLAGCVNGTCLPRPPRVVRVQRGISSNIFVDNKAYREFLNSKFNATAIDMETAAIALVCHQQNMPFIAFRSLSDLAGGGSALSNEAASFATLAAQNAVDVLLRFISLLSS